MNPRTLKWQAAACSVLFVFLAIFGVPSTAAGVCVIGLVATLMLNHQYARALAEQGRTARRMKGDRLVSVEVAGLFLPALGLAVAFLAAGYESDLHIWHFSHTSISALLTIASIFGALIMLSSLVDWYYIRPRLDGIVRSPESVRKTV